MNAKYTLASLAMRAATWLLRKQRPEWGEAMRAEFQHLAARHEQLRWAMGCLAAAINQRLSPMNTGSLRVSRWVMLVEALGCFGPATLAWYTFTFGPGGLVHMNVAGIEKTFAEAPTYALVMWCAYSVFGLFAPIGLFLGLRWALTGHALRSRLLGFTLITGPIVQAIVSTVVYVSRGAPGDLVTVVELGILCVVLPVAGILHLMYLGNAIRTSAQVAAA